MSSKKPRVRNTPSMKAKRALYEQTANGRWCKFRSGSKGRGLAVDISKRDFVEITSSLCSYCGERNPGRDFVGIDRLDSSKGYLKLNCVPCCASCNYMKQDMSVDEWFGRMERILKFSR